MTILLGIDLGTSSLKAILLQSDGQILAQGSAEYNIQCPRPGHAEQSPDIWWQSARIAIQQILSKVELLPSSIGAIGLSGQMHGTVFLDKRGNLLGPAVIWPDQRSRQQVKEITGLVGATRLIQITGSPAATGFQAATIRWFQQHAPDTWRKVHMILTPKDYLRWRLTGELASESSDGSGTLLLDKRTRDWSGEILDILEISRRSLPPIKPSDGLAGALSREAADYLGLFTGLPVVTGAADTACGLLGAGIVDEDNLLLTISSGGQLVIPAVEASVDLKGRMHTFCSALHPGPQVAGWYQMAATLSAGLSLRWLRDQVFGLDGDAGYAQMVDWAESVPAGAKGLLFLPYLMGERTPLMDSQARGMFLGLTTSHGRAEMVRAVMEGVALGLYDAYETLLEVGAKPERIIAAGGGAKSLLWLQIVADSFNLPVYRLKTGEQAALGAVLLAGSGIGLFEVRDTSLKWADYEEPIAPNGQQNAVFHELLGIFRSAYVKHRADFGRLSQLAATEKMEG